MVVDLNTYQEHDGNVEQESHRGIGNQSKTANTVDVIHGDGVELGEQEDQAVHDGTGWSVVVKRDKRVHLELSTAEKALDHGQTDGLEQNATCLPEESSQDELDFTKGSNNHTDDNEGDVSESLQVGWVDPQTPSGQKDSNGHCGLLITG